MKHFSDKVKLQKDGEKLSSKEIIKRKIKILFNCKRRQAIFAKVGNLHHVRAKKYHELKKLSKPFLYP